MAREVQSRRSETRAHKELAVSLHSVWGRQTDICISVQPSGFHPHFDRLKFNKWSSLWEKNLKVTCNGISPYRKSTLWKFLYKLYNLYNICVLNFHAGWKAEEATKEAQCKFILCCRIILVYFPFCRSSSLGGLLATSPPASKSECHIRGWGGGKVC